MASVIKQINIIISFNLIGLITYRDRNSIMFLVNQLFVKISPSQRSLVVALAAFFFYGAWAYWVNLSHGVSPALRAACVQGSYSLLLTFTITMLTEYIYLFFCRLLDNSLLINWATIVFVCTCVFSTSWWVNAMAGTPEIFRTVILGYLIGGTYTVLYVYGLARSNRPKSA